MLKTLFATRQVIGKLLLNILFTAFTCLSFQNICAADWGASISFTSNYIDHGYSKSDDKPALLANIDYLFDSGIFLGVDLATVDFDDHHFRQLRFKDRSRVEISPYLGWYRQLSSDWNMTLRWQRYLYDGKIFGRVADYNLFSTALHYRDLLSIRAAFSDDFYAQNSASAHYKLNALYPITDTIQLSSTLEYNQSRASIKFDYLAWSAGFTWHHPYGAIDLRYVDSAIVSTKKSSRSSWKFYPDAVDATAVLTISFGF